MCNFLVPAGKMSCSPSPPMWKGLLIEWYRRERSCLLRSPSPLEAMVALAPVKGKRQSSELHELFGHLTMRACLHPFLQLPLLCGSVAQQWRATAMMETGRAATAKHTCPGAKIQPAGGEKRGRQWGVPKGAAVRSGASAGRVYRYAAYSQRRPTSCQPDAYTRQQMTPYDLSRPPCHERRR